MEAAGCSGEVDKAGVCAHLPPVHAYRSKLYTSSLNARKRGGLDRDRYSPSLLVTTQDWYTGVGSEESFRPTNSTLAPACAGRNTHDAHNQRNVPRRRSINDKGKCEGHDLEPGCGQQHQAVTSSNKQ